MTRQLTEIVLASRDDIPAVPLGAWRTSEIWCPVGAPFGAYQASSRGRIRSVDRTAANGRAYKGVVLSARLSHRGPSAGTRHSYEQVNVTAGDGTKHTRPVHWLVTLAFEGPRPAGQPETRHYNDQPLDNRWAPGATKEERQANGGNLGYGSREDQERDQAENNPPEPRPPRPVVLCEPHGRPVVNGSKVRCQACIEQLGIAGARLIASGLSPAEAAEQLGYSSPDGLVRHAKNHGGLIETITYSLAGGTPPVILAGDPPASVIRNHPVTSGNVPDGGRRRVSRLRRLFRQVGDSQ